MSQPEELLRHPPAPLALKAIQLPTTYQTTLSNGLALVIVEDKRLPLMSYRLAFRTGDAHDPQELPGLTDMMAGLLTEGTQSHSSREIAEEVERLGATLHAGAGSDYTTVAASSLSVFGDKILELMAEVTLQPSFPENEVELRKQNLKESLKQQRAQPAFLANEMVSRVMFGEHPYHVISPSPESIDAMTRAGLIAFHQSRFIPNNAVFIVVGDVQRDAIITRVEQLFGSWQRGVAATDEFPAPPAHRERVAYLVDRAGSAQSNIVIANSGIMRTSPDYLPLLLMHTVLGATASSRLFMNLREEKGYTYGAYSNLDARRTAGTFRATAEVRTPVTGDSLKEFFYELEKIRSEPVSEKEITDAKSYLTGVFPIRLETQEGVIDQLVQIKMLGLPDNYLETYRDRIQSVTVDQIQSVALRYVKPDEASLVIVGDGKQVVEQLKPYADTIEFYNTAGKRKEMSPANGQADKAADNGLGGTWTLEIQTPFGQEIPATLTLIERDGALSGKVESEMGSGDVSNVGVDVNQFHATISIEMDGHKVEASINGMLEADRIEGSITLQDLPPLPFTGTRE